MRTQARQYSPTATAFFLTAYFSEEDYPYDWLMLWLSRRPEWQRSREFETTTRTSTPGFGTRAGDNSFGDDDEDADDVPGKVRTRVVFDVAIGDDALGRYIPPPLLSLPACPSVLTRASPESSSSSTMTPHQRRAKSASAQRMRVLYAHS